MPTIGTKPWYKDWFNSPFYHKLYFERNEEEAKNFISKLMGFLEIKPGSRILDAACGRGRHSIVLADMGFDVTGIDLAMNSIEFAKQFERENLQFYQHDYRLFFRSNYFDCVLNLFTSFGYFATKREHDDGMRTFAAALKPDGILVFDYLNTHFVEEHLVHQESRQISGTSFEIRRWDDETHFYKKIRIKDPSLTAPEEHTEKVCKFSLGDFTEMLAFQGMQIIDVFGNYSLAPYDTTKTPRMIIVAGKKVKNESSENEKRLYSDGRRTDALG